MVVGGLYEIRQGRTLYAEEQCLTFVGAVGWVKFIPRSDVSLVSKRYLRAHGLDSPLPSSENP